MIEILSIFAEMHCDVLLWSLASLNPVYGSVMVDNKSVFESMSKELSELNRGIPGVILGCIHITIQIAYYPLLWNKLLN